MNPGPKKKSIFEKQGRFIPLYLLLLLIGVVYFFNLQRYFHWHYLNHRLVTFKDWVECHPALAPLLFIGICIAVAGLSLPFFEIVSIMGGFLFPNPWSTMMIVIGGTLGACIIFFVTKTAFGNFLKRITDKKMEKFRSGLEHHATSYLLFLRISSLCPFWILNIAAGFFQIRFRVFFWTTLFGIIPINYIHTQIAEGIRDSLAAEKPISWHQLSNVHFRIALLGLAVACLLPLLGSIIYQKWKTKKGKK